MDRKLRFRLGLFLVIGIGLLGLICWDVFQAVLPWWMAIAAVGIGYAIGVVFGRSMKVRWDAERERIVTQLDIVGILVIAIYVVLAIFRNWLLDQWLTGVTLTAVTFAVAAGVLIGRYFGVRHRIRRLIEHSERDPGEVVQ